MPRSYPERNAEVARQYLAGRSYSEIGRALGVSRNAVKHIIHTARVAGLLPPVDPSAKPYRGKHARNAQFLEMWDSGVPISNIAYAMEVSVETVRGVVRRERQRPDQVPERPENADRNAEIVRLWNDEQLSYSAIGARLGLTRAVVSGAIGRARRAGLSVAVHETPQPQPASPKQRAQRQSKPAATVVRFPKAKDVPEPLRHEDPHEPMGCRFIYGDPRKEWRYCQQVKPLGSSWCDRHRSIVFRRPVAEDEAA